MQAEIIQYPEKVQKDLTMNAKKLCNTLKAGRNNFILIQKKKLKFCLSSFPEPFL
jgi:hypothetical protein